LIELLYGKPNNEKKISESKLVEGEGTGEVYYPPQRKTKTTLVIGADFVVLLSLVIRIKDLLAFLTIPRLPIQG